jgi:hypothetical protein
VIGVKSDSNGSIRKLYGVRETLGLIADRVTYVIGNFNSQFQP